MEFWNLEERAVAECEIVLDLRPCQRWLMITDAAGPPFASLIKNGRALEVVWCRVAGGDVQARDSETTQTEVRFA